MSGNFNRYIDGYVHQGRIGVLIELEVAIFSSRQPEFVALARDLAMQVASMEPGSVAELLNQAFVKEPAVTVEQQVSQLSQRFKETISIIRFVRWKAEVPMPFEPEPPGSPAVIYRVVGEGWRAVIGQECPKKQQVTHEEVHGSVCTVPDVRHGRFWERLCDNRQYSCGTDDKHAAA